MGYKLADAVYRLKKGATTPSEQAVLLALAFRANDNTLFCYPRQETLSDMTHLSRSTVIAALRSLKARGFVDWKKGGKTVKRRKGGHLVSNDYRLNVENIRAAGKGRRAKIEPPEAIVPEKRRGIVSNGVLSPTNKLLSLLDLTPGTREYADNYNAFGPWLAKLGLKGAEKFVCDFRDRLIDGDVVLNDYDNPPAAVMSHLKEYIDFYSNSQKGTEGAATAGQGG